VRQGRDDDDQQHGEAEAGIAQAGCHGESLCTPP
jgi:hypothetical protein